MYWMVGYKKNNTEFETVVENNYCHHNPLNVIPPAHFDYAPFASKKMKLTECIV
jgi:hypothetical protein